MEHVQDPLRFGDLTIEGETSEEIPLHDEAQEGHDRFTQAEAGRREAHPFPGAAPSRPALVPGAESTLSHNGYVTATSSISHSAAHTVARGPLTESTLENVDLGKPEEPQPSSSSLFKPLPSESTFSAASSAPSPSIQQQTGALVHVTVTDPVKVVSDHPYIPGLNSSHYEYLVTSSPLERAAATAGMQPWPKGDVRRRFNDFVSLADLLTETHRGYFLHPRPDKGALEAAAAGRSEAEFVEMRRAELERYLRQLVAHPIAGRSEELRVFLIAEGSLATSFEWRQLLPLRGSLAEGVARLPRQLLGSDSSIPTTTDVTKNPRHTNDLMRRFRELGERMRQEYQAPRDLPPDEVVLRETKAGVEAYAEALSNASRKAEKVVRELERSSSLNGNLGLALMALAKYEDEQTRPLGSHNALAAPARALAADLRRVGMVSIRYSRCTRPAIAESVISLQSVHDELALAPAVVEALQEREAALLTVQSVNDDIDKRRSALEILENGSSVPGDATKARKAQTLRNEIAGLEAALEAAETEYQRVKERNEAELQRWRYERAQAMTGMVRGFGFVQAALREREAEFFQTSLEDLQPAA